MENSSRISRRSVITGAASIFAASGWSGCGGAPESAELPPITVAGNMTTIELSPVLIAADSTYPGPITVINGGLPALVAGEVDAATNAETQLLRQSVDDPSLRIIFTVAESFYRIVARRSAGIETVADLRGKRITTPRNTSAHYFLVKTLGLAGIAQDEFELVPITPVTAMSEALRDRQVDAVSMWEPESEYAIDEAGDDAIVLQDRSVYRELFNLHSSTAVLADPAKRAALVELLRSLIAASGQLRTTPETAWPIVSPRINVPVEMIERCYPNLGYAGSMVPDLLDVLEEEEQWVAQERDRAPRGPDELAGLIDRSLLEEAQGG